MDHKGPAYEFVNLSESIRRARVDDGFVYQVETGRSTPPERPKKPWTPSGKLDQDQAKQYEDELDAHDKKMATWAATIYWSQPVFAYDRVVERDKVSRLEETVAKLDLKMHTVKVSEIETNGPGSSFRRAVDGRFAPVQFADSYALRNDAPRAFDGMQDIPRSASYVTGRVGETRGSASRSVRVRLFDAFRAFVLELY